MAEPDTTGLGPLGRLVFLDRYSQKDQDRSHLRVGQTVVACLDPTKTQQRELGEVLAIRGGKAAVRIGTTDVDLPIDYLDLPIESLADAQMRMAGFAAKAENGAHERWWPQFYELLRPLDFVPGGRVWAGAGVEHQLTPYNCFVLPPPRDSLHGIFEACERMAEVFRRGGGVGFPIMTLRPHFSLVKKVNGRSSGSVSWAEIYSFATGLIEQGGSRRGALMLIQYCWHPDILEFVNAKRNREKLNNCNVSVAVTDAFMAAVEADADWDLVFPDTSDPDYDRVWNGDLDQWRASGKPLKVHKTLKARELWHAITEAAHASAEPGLFFVDRYNAFSNSYYYPQGKIYCTNPCGEQGLPAWAVCNLGHINVAKHLVGDGMHGEPAKIDFTKLIESVQTAVRFMDDVIDAAYSPFPENATQQLAERRIGLGTLGLGEALIRCHVRYGYNAECLRLVEKVYRTIAIQAYRTSIELAAEKGAFPLFDADKFLASGFMQMMPEDLRSAARPGVRNVTLLTQAPTGTLGTMINSSTGIECYPYWEWDRSGQLGTHHEQAPVYTDFLANGGNPKDMPPWMVTANDIAPEDHAYVQATVQRWTDASISKTSNLPHNFTTEQVGEYYQLLHKLGCKGGTVYRDRSRDKQVINQVAKPRAEVRPTPDGSYAMRARSIKSPVGKISVKIGIAPEDKLPFEVWIDLSKGGTAINADREALARLMSLIMRIDSPVDPYRRMELIADQIIDIGGGESIGVGEARVLSLPDGVGKAMLLLLEDLRAKAEKREAKRNGANGHSLTDICPKCHQSTLVYAEGCFTCKSCGYSKC